MQKNAPITIARTARRLYSRSPISAPHREHTATPQRSMTISSPPIARSWLSDIINARPLAPLAAKSQIRFASSFSQSSDNRAITADDLKNLQHNIKDGSHQAPDDDTITELIRNKRQTTYNIGDPVQESLHSSAISMTQALFEHTPNSKEAEFSARYRNSVVKMLLDKIPDTAEKFSVQKARCFKSSLTTVVNNQRSAKILALHTSQEKDKPTKTFKEFLKNEMEKFNEMHDWLNMITPTINK